MKYEEIEIGKKYRDEQFVLEVKYKQESTKEVVALDDSNSLYIYNDFEYEDWQPLKPKLPDTGLICATDDSLLIMRTGSESGYGFDYLGQWMNHDSWSFETNPDYWRPATKEDKKRWIELLTEEAKRRGYKNGNHDCLTGMRVSDVNDNNYFWANNSFWIGDEVANNLIMRDGKWADIIEDEKPTQNEIDKVLEHFGSQGFGMYKTEDILEKVDSLEQLKNYKADLISKTVANLDEVIEKLRKEY